MTAQTDEARAGFQNAFGYAPSGVWSAPGRVNLIGEHTDYNEGYVLPFAIDRRTSVAVALRGDSLVRVSSTLADEIVELPLTDIAPGAVSGWAAYPLGVVWGLAQLAGADLDAVPGFDAHFVSDVPLGAGLSSSAAIEASLATALNDVWRLGRSPEQLVRPAQLGENEVVGAPTGILDQSASLLSHAGSALFIDCRDGSSRPIDLGLEDAGLAVLVMDTGVEHQLADGDGGYAARRASCEKAAAELGVDALRDVTLPQLLAARETLDGETYRRARHVVTENQRVLDTVQTLAEQGPEAIGDLMFASHRSMRDDFEISTPELDLAVEISLNYGAIGARMTGGGFGGSAIALVPRHMISHVQVAIDGAFAEHGWRQPEMFVVEPSPGAGRDL